MTGQEGSMETKKDQLLGLLHKGINGKQAYFVSLNESERSAAGSRDRWSPNDVCAHIAGDRQKALADLRQAFAVRSDLVEWSQRDTDLQSLWKDSEYRALL
jgi:hypothetical protein